MTNLAAMFFSFRGRLNRAKYWLALLVYFVVLYIGNFLEYDLGFQLINLLMFLAVMVSGVSVGIRRLHDRNKSAWWLLLLYLLPTTLFLASVMVAASSGEITVATIRQGVISGSGVALLLGFSAAAIWLWALIELGGRRGTPGPNRFGPDPLTSMPAVSRTS
jgi:uncharacterized membrane protein YhaH (DUF805 family)